MPKNTVKAEFTEDCNQLTYVHLPQEALWGGGGGGGGGSEILTVLLKILH